MPEQCCEATVGCTLRPHVESFIAKNPRRCRRTIDSYLMVILENWFLSDNRRLAPNTN